MDGKPQYSDQDSLPPDPPPRTDTGARIGVCNVIESIRCHIARRTNSEMQRAIRRTHEAQNANIKRLRATARRMCRVSLRLRERRAGLARQLPAHPHARKINLPLIKFLSGAFKYADAELRRDLVLGANGVRVDSELLRLNKTPCQRRPPGERPTDSARRKESDHFKCGETFRGQ